MTDFMVRQEKEKAEKRIEDLWEVMQVISKNIKYAQQTLEGQMKNGFVPSPSLLSDVANMARSMQNAVESIGFEQRMVNTLSNTLKYMEA